MRLWAISDLHVSHPENRRAVDGIAPHPADWLILAGDIGETIAELRWVLTTLGPRFAQLIWAPGNHELWTLPKEGGARGVAKYEELVAVCRQFGALTPEDPYPLFTVAGVSHVVAPLFTLYDYSYAPDQMTPQQAVAWAIESGVECVDEHLLHADPYSSREAWCIARCAESEARLEAATRANDHPTVLVNHFPMLSSLATVPRYPRFRIWCGSQRTRSWPQRFRASTVVYGHLHMPSTRFLNGVRYEEVSLGYPERNTATPRSAKLRLILPQPEA